MAKHTADELRAIYGEWLQTYLSDSGEEASAEVHELGHAALTEGVGVLEMVTMQYKALAGIMRGCGLTKGAEMTEKAAALASENLASFEMILRGTRDAVADLRRLNEQLNERAEESSRRLAHTLHDEAGQLLAAVFMELGILRRRCTSDVQEDVNRIESRLREVNEQLRRISHELRPLILDDLGVVAALQFLAEGVSSRSGLSIWVEAEVTESLRHSVETAVYRTVQEALNNVARHSKAKNVVIQLEREGATLRCSIIDDGVGFDTGALATRRGERGLGFLGMQERVAGLNGQLEVTSAPGEGTRITALFPVEAAAPVC